MESKVKDFIINVFKSISNRDMFAIHNEYIDDRMYYEDRIDEMSSFNEMFEGYSPLEIASLVQGERFSVYDNFFKTTMWSGVESADDVEKLVSDWDDFVEWFVDKYGFEGVKKYCSEDDISDLDELLAQ